MISNLLLLLLFRIFSILNAEIIETPNSPSLYCFVIPPERTSFDPNILTNISCTHFVYGSIPIDNRYGRPEFNNWDVVHGLRDGNMRRFLRLRMIHRNAKFLLGVQRSAPFADSFDAIQVANGLRVAYKDKMFDGVFVSFKGFHLQKRSSTIFIEHLAKNAPLKPTIGVTAYRIWQKEAVERLSQVLSSIQHIYVDMSVLPTNEDQFVVTKIDPLFENGPIHYEDTIQGTVDRLMEEGIMGDQIIVGLTVGGWRFKVSNVIKATHGDFSMEKGERISYQEACKTRGSMIFDKTTLNEIKMNRQTWIVSNLPTINAMGKKINWALTEKLAGVGLSTIFNDDPKAECGTDPLPAHSLAAQLTHQKLPSSRAECSRICYIDSRRTPDDFPFDAFKSEFCSHVVVDFFQLDTQKVVLIPEKSEEMFERVQEWRKRVGEMAPKLILSMGSNEPSNVWSFLLGNDLKRKQLIEDVLQTIVEKKADGLEISWSLEPLSNEFDKNNLNSLIEDVKNVEKKRPIEILIGASAESSFANFYDVKFFNKSVDLVVLHTHRLHSKNSPVTGHPSPIYNVPSMLNPKMSLEKLLEYWTSNGMARQRLAVSLSASTLTMTTLIDKKTLESSPFGKSTILNVFRSENGDLKTQDEICEALQMNSTKSFWNPTAAVSFLLRDDQMIAYENEQSVMSKTIWASMEGVGIAIHQIHADDPHAVCNNRTAFPILTQITKMQTCTKCLKPHDFRKCQNHDFIVSCSYDLKKSKPHFRPEILPFERCTEIIVEQAILNSTGHINFHDSYQSEVVKNLTTLRDKMGKCGMILSVSCGSSERNLTNLMLDRMDQTIQQILSVMDQFKFSGILLDCEKAVERNNNIQFNTFLKILNQKIEEKSSNNGCIRTLSMRFSDLTVSPNSLYRVSQLNKLSHIALSPQDKNHIDYRLFSNSSVDQKSMEYLVSKWVRSGVNSSKLVLELSPIGYRINENSSVDPLTQGQICEDVGNRAKFTDNFQLYGSELIHKSKLIIKPTVSTFKYKVGYAIREKLGGVSMRNLNFDDYTGICGRGSFPILKSIYNKNNCH